MLLCTLQAGEDDLCLLEVLEGTRCVLLCMLEVLEGGLCLMEVMRCVLGALYARGRGGWALFAGDDALCAALYA